MIFFTETGERIENRLLLHVSHSTQRSTRVEYIFLYFFSASLILFTMCVMLVWCAAFIQHKYIYAQNINTNPACFIPQDWWHLIFSNRRISQIDKKNRVQVSKVVNVNMSNSELSLIFPRNSKYWITWRDRKQTFLTL